PEKIAKPIEEHARKVIENHVIDQFEVKIPGKNGDERIILTRQFPIENSERTITALGGVMHDVTEIQLAETRMRDSFLRLSTILESTQEGFITIDNKGIIETVNPAGCQIFGYDASELLGQDVSILMQKDEQSAHKGYIKNSKTLEPKIIHKTRNLTGKKKDGNLFPLELNISPMTLSGEKKIVGCFKDISERKAWENELLHSDERLKRSQAFAKIGTWDWTIETGELFWSEQIAILFGYDKGELETTFDNFVAALHPDDREAVLGAVNACVHDNADYDIEHRVIWPDGSVRWLHEKGDVIRKGDGSPDRMLGVVSDITQQKNLEQALHSARENLEQQVDERTHELKDAKDAAQRADYAKSEFLANMSHELRTPLNGILGFSEMMKIETFGPIQNETYKTYINDIHYSGGYLLNIINEILDLSRIESGEAEMEMVNVHINDIFDFSVNAVTQQATKASVEISIDIEDGLPPLLADKTRLQQIIINLLSNGVNYNHETGGLVTLRAKSQSNGGLAIIVEDNGIGIDEENIDRVMGRFEKAHSSHARTSTGIGLGLPIVRLLCERHKANFSLESEEGKGTVAMVAFAKDQLVAPQVQ
ncbi:MAG: PAS domain S-box protein, partial [Rhodospirillales bacterium]|nr:PAS domain S-box protein [Rhodospirillales bacterium]